MHQVVLTENAKIVPPENFQPNLVPLRAMIVPPDDTQGVMLTQRAKIVPVDMQQVLLTHFV